MAATALIKFTQGTIVGIAGQVLVGYSNIAVTVTNDVNTGVASWQVDLVYVPPDSGVLIAIPLAFNNNSNTPSATFTPDIAGSYRLVLKVWDVINRAGTPTDFDIRNFVIADRNGVILPPYQKDPDPRPTLASGQPGAKPNEMNINGSELGWEGNGRTDGLLASTLQRNVNPLVTAALGGDGLVVDTIDAPAPFLNFPLNVIYDGTFLWVAKNNVGQQVISGGPDVESWGVAKLDPRTNLYVEDLRQTLVAPVFANDIITKLVWTGTQLFAFGHNFVQGDCFVREILRGNGAVRTTLNTRCSLTGVGPDFLIGAEWDSINGKVWVLTQSTGTLYRFDPSTFSGLTSTPETVSALFPTCFDLKYDSDTAAYPDVKPRLYVATGPSGNTVYRISNLDTTPVIDASATDDSQKLTLGAGFLFGIQPGLITRFIKEPFAVDITNGTATNILGLTFDPLTSQLFVAYNDITTGNPQVDRVQTSLVTDDTVVLDTEVFQGVSGLPFDMAVVNPGLLAPSTLHVPESGASRAGYGNVWAVGITTVIPDTGPAAAVSTFGLRYGPVNQKIQYMVAPGDVTNMTWDGVSDVIAILFSAPAPTTVNIGLAPRGKQLTIVDVGGTASPTNPISFSISVPTSVISPITTANGFLQLVGVGFGAWAEQGGSGFTVPAGDLAGTNTAPLVAGIQGAPILPQASSVFRGEVLGSPDGSSYTILRRPVESQGQSVAGSSPAFATTKNLGPTINGNHLSTITSDGSSLWALDIDLNVIVRLSRQTLTQEFSFTPVNTPVTLIVAQGFLWVVTDNVGTINVEKYSLTTPGSLLTTIVTGFDDGVTGPITYHAPFLLIPSQNGVGDLELVRVNVFTGAFSATAGGTAINNITGVAYGNGRVVVSCNSGIYVFNGNGDTYLGQKAIPILSETPQGMAFDGTFFYFINAAASPRRLNRIRLPLDVSSAFPIENDFTGTFPDTNTYDALLWDGVSLWAFSGLGGNVIQVDPVGGDPTGFLNFDMFRFSSSFALGTNLLTSHAQPHFDGEMIWLPGLTTTPRLLRVHVPKPGGVRRLKQVTSVTTSPYNVTLADEILSVSTAAARTINLPANPYDGMEITVYDRDGTAATNNITVSPNGGLINGSGSSVVINTAFGKLSFAWVITFGWIIITRDVTGGASFSHTITASTPFTITTEDAVGVNVAGNSTINLPSGLTSAKTILIYDWSGNINTNSQISIVPPVGHNIDNTFTNGSPLVIGDNFSAVWLLWTNSSSRWILLNQQRVPNSILTTSAASTTLTARDQLVLVDSAVGARTVNLPSIPSRDQVVTIKDRDNNAGTNNITVGRNGNPIDGLTSNYILATNAGSVTLVWTNSTSTSFGWRVI